MNSNNIDRDSLLIWLYTVTSDYFQQTEFALYTDRFSKNDKLIFTDAELFACATFTEIVGFLIDTEPIEVCQPQHSQ